MDFSSKDGQISTFGVSGRPKWAVKVTKKLEPKEGEVRGHIIEWNLRSRAFVSKYKGDKKSLLALLDLGKTASDEVINTAIHRHMKGLYNDLGNLRINDEKQDTDAGGRANEIAQIIDAGRAGGKKTELLKELYSLSFNPGSSAEKWLNTYNETFSNVWGVDTKALERWAQEAGFAQSSEKGTTTSTSELEQEEKKTKIEVVKKKVKIFNRPTSKLKESKEGKEGKKILSTKRSLAKISDPAEDEEQAGEDEERPKVEDKEEKDRRKRREKKKKQKAKKRAKKEQEQQKNEKDEEKTGDD
jgi:hypothetical protein